MSHANLELNQGTQTPTTKNTEQPIAVIKQLDGFDLFFTTKRIVGLRLSSKNTSNYAFAAVGGLVSGVMGALVLPVVAKKISAAKKDGSTDFETIAPFDLAVLDENAAKKGCFSLPLPDLEMFALNKCQICIKGKKVWKYLIINKEQFKFLEFCPYFLTCNIKSKLTLNLTQQIISTIAQTIIPKMNKW